MTVDHTATRAGRKFQNDLMRYLRKEHLLDAERLVLTGTQDEGDILVRLPKEGGYEPLIIEAKREKRVDLAGWVAQAQLEAGNYAEHRYGERGDAGYIVVAARRNHGIGDAYVITTLDEYLRQVR